MAGQAWSEATNNGINIDGAKAAVAFDPDVRMLRGEVVGLNGGTDVYAETVGDLTEEGRESPAAYLDLCRDKGIALRPSSPQQPWA